MARTMYVFTMHFLDPKVEDGKAPMCCVFRTPPTPEQIAEGLEASNGVKDASRLLPYLRGMPAPKDLAAALDKAEKHAKRKGGCSWPSLSLTITEGDGDVVCAICRVPLQDGAFGARMN